MSGIIKLSSASTREYWEINILFEDEHLLALNKPPRLLSVPEQSQPEKPSLLKLLHADITRGAAWARQREITYLSNVHRLDFETTGVFLLARNKLAQLALANQFGSEKPSLTDVALVRGVPAKKEFAIDAKLAPYPVNPDLIRVDSRKGKRARTEFSVRELFAGYALMECRPLTNRTHQVRVHLKHAKLPIVGDSVYGAPPLLLSKLKTDYHLKPGAVERPLISHTALHAEQLTFSHPVSEAPITILAPWPKDFTVAVKYLRRYAIG